MSAGSLGEFQRKSVSGDGMGDDVPCYKSRVSIAEQILRQCNVVAVVGMSRHPQKAAHYVPKQLMEAGFCIVPINPEVDEILGQRAFPNLEAIPFPVDLVLVFRPSNKVLPFAQAAVAIGAKALWLQQGITHPEARRLATEAGILYVEDECAAVVRSIHDIHKMQAK